MLRAASVRAGLGVLVLLAVFACGGGGGDDGGGVGPDPLSIEFSGRLERGSTISLDALLDGSPVLATDLTWTAQPSDAVEFLSNGDAKLLKAGSVTVTATSQGKSGSRVLAVLAPPSILFDQTMGGNRDIYTVAIDGGDFLRLTTHAGDDRDAALSGQVIWFTSYRDGNGELYVMPSSGGGETRQTTSTPTEEHEVAFMPSAAGVALGNMAYTSNATGVAKLWTSSNLTPAGQAAPSFGYSGSIDASPSWSTDGSIVFMSTAGGQADLYILKNGSVGHVDVGQTPNFEPAFHRQGTKIVFGSSRSGPAKLYVYHVAEDSVSALTSGTGDDGQATWLADGRVVFTSWRSGSAKLYWVDPEFPDDVHEIPTQGTDPQRPSAR